jgi:hypothetical protein
MQTYTTTKTKDMPARVHNSCARMRLLLADTGCEPPGYVFNIGCYPDRRDVVVNAPIHDKAKAGSWFRALTTLLPWACSATLDSERGTITITPVEAS